VRGLELGLGHAVLLGDVVVGEHGLTGGEGRVELEAVVADPHRGAVRELLDGLLEDGVAQVAERADDVAPDVDDDRVGGAAEDAGAHQSHHPSTAQTPESSDVSIMISGVGAGSSSTGVSSTSSGLLDCMVKKLPAT
jgi:hypothetical protein